jgi:hypothetical protein
LVKTSFSPQLCRDAPCPPSGFQDYRCRAVPLCRSLVCCFSVMRNQASWDRNRSTHRAATPIGRRGIAGLGVLSIRHKAKATAINARSNTTSGQLLIKSSRLGGGALRRRLPAMPQHRVIAGSGSIADSLTSATMPQALYLGYKPAQRFALSAARGRDGCSPGAGSLRAW